MEETGSGGEERRRSVLDREEKTRVKSVRRCWNRFCPDDARPSDIGRKGEMERGGSWRICPDDDDVDDIYDGENKSEGEQNF